ncbi:MAG TPA: hypothetical protein VIF09_14290 [Polyangiaceae bacterium]
MGSRITLASKAAASFLPLLAACDKGDGGAPSPSAAAQAPIASVARVLGVDAGELEPSVDPPAPAGDLRAEIDQFTTVDACVAQHAKLDPLLGDALEGIGYDTFVRDACRGLEAAKARDARRCDGIDASSLRRRCQTTVAELVGDADACPWEMPSRPALGRDAACLAIASHDPRLCAGAEGAPARATCEAIVRHHAAPCAALAERADQVRCARDAERWRTATPAPGEHDPALALPTGKLRVEGGDAGAPVETSLTTDLGRGVVLVEQRDGARLQLGPLTEVGPGFIAPSPHTRASLALDLFVTPDGKRSRVDRAELLVPGRAPVSTPAAASTLAVTVDKLEHVRGGRVSLTLDGTLTDSTASWRVHTEASTFVRDVVKASAIYGAGLPGPRLGDAGGMR